MVFLEPVTRAAIEPRGAGQRLLSISLEPIAREMSAEARRLRERTPEQLGKISRNRYVVHNAWVVAGTRVPTLAVWHFHRAGYSTEAIIAEYPRLTAEDVAAAIDFESKRQRVA